MACASPPRVVSPAASLPLPTPSPDRLASLRERLPELAASVERLHRLAEAYEARGDRALARELSHMAELTLVHGLALGATAPTRDDMNDAPVAAETCEPVPESEPAPVERTLRRRSPRSRRSGEEPSARREAPDEGTVMATTPTERVAARLAVVAEATADAEHDGAVDPGGLEAIRRGLIEADRALAEGLIERAEALADDAERTLASLQGAEPEDGSAPGPSRGLVADAQDLLGERARPRGPGTVAVRLDEELRFEGAWRATPGSPLDALRPLVRAYRDAELRLLRVALPANSPFRDEGASLAAFLSARFQVPLSRLHDGQGGAGLAPGLYLMMRER
ncbi:MAG: hypothetical protein AAF447_16935 [Myxococcota bacterium]